MAGALGFLSLFSFYAAAAVGIMTVDVATANHAKGLRDNSQPFIYFFACRSIACDNACAN